MNKLNRINKLIIIISIITLFVPTINIKAEDIITNEQSEGKSAEYVEGRECANGEDNCYAWSEEFRIEVALVDANMNIVTNPVTGEKTQSVRFDTYQSTPYNYSNYFSWNRERSTINGEILPMGLAEAMDPYLSQDVHMAGMYTVIYNNETDLSGKNVIKGNLSEKIYDTYLGFGEGEEIANDFSDYEENRKKFINYVTSFERKNHVEDETFNGNVSFLDFFLKVSGYTDVWDYTADPTRLSSLIGKDYYLVIEPVYTIVATKNGMDHSYTGTAKRLGNLLWLDDSGWANADKSKNWLGIFNIFNEPKYNMLCNFYDKSNYLNLRQIYPNSKDSGYYMQNYEHLCTDPNNAYYFDTRTMSNLLGWVDSPFGVNIISLKYDSQIPIPTTFTCNLNVNSCENDSFKFESKLTAVNGNDDDIYNCIYPNKVQEDNLKDYVYHIGENGKELWCYDDLTYDFSDLKESIIDSEFTVGQLKEMPSGKLTVNRTCYSNVNESELGGYIDQVFGDGDPGTYQDTFEFTFGKDSYKYVRQPEKKGTTYTKKEIKDKANPFDPDKHYKYTSTFYYDYDIENSIIGASGININDYSLSNSYIASNSIKFVTQFDRSSIITIRTQDELSKTYNNSITSNINNGYGISTGLYNKLLENKTETDDNELTKLITSTLSTQYNENIVEFNLNEVKKQSCDVETTIENKNIYGDGMKFRVISLDEPFPGRDGTIRFPGKNWVNKYENNVYDYIENNRNIQEGKADPVSPQYIYTEKEPLYTVTLDATSMIKIREYNKTHSYNNASVICDNDTGRRCIDAFIRNDKYIDILGGTCGAEKVSWQNKTDYYTCADKTEKSGG